MDDTPNDEAPWSIPIREAGPDIPQRAATWIDRVPVAPMVVGVIALFACLVIALLVLDGDPSESGPEVLGADADTTTTTVAAPVDAPSSSVTPSTVDATTTTTTTSTTTTTPPVAAETPAPTSSPTVPADPIPAGLPIHTPGDLRAGWVAQVSSVPASAGGAALARSYETVRTTVPDAIIVRGGDWASLRNGFWVILRAGYDDAAAAVEACDSWGLEGRDACFARVLSPDDDGQRICWRDETGSLAGTCT